MASQDCPVCMEQYDNEERCPRCLSCGHTLCTTCVAGIIGRGPLDCPFCRNTHFFPVTSAKDVPVNYTVVSILQEASVFTSKRKSSALLAEVKKEVNELITSQLMSFNSRLTHLKDFKQCLSEQQSVLDFHIQDLKSLVEKNEGLLKEVTNTADQVAVAITKGMEKRSFMEAQQARVGSATSLDEVTAVQQDDCNSDDVREWGAVAHQLLQSPVLATAREMKLAMSTTLQALVDGNMSDMSVSVTLKKTQAVPHTHQDQDQLSLFPKDQKQDSRPYMTQLLSDMIKNLRWMGGEMWIVTMVEGQRHCAKIIQVDKHLYLSAFKEGDPPDSQRILPYYVVRRLIDETCMRIFLEISWAGQVQGRVCIKLLNTEPRTRQFFLLCSGERGHSYANTRLLEVENRGKLGERVWGGDYEKNDGSGGAALPGLTMGDLSVKSVMSGLVAGFCYGDDYHLPAHFVIYNNDCPVLYEECPIGKVEHGMEVVRMAAKLANIQEATISDCGIVL